MVDAVEEFLQVEIDDPFVPVLQIPLGLGEPTRRPTRTLYPRALGRVLTGSDGARQLGKVPFS
jgi:hypothetical protein